VIRKLSLSTGIITSLAGIGFSVGSLGDGGPASAALLNTPANIAFDGGRMLYVTDLQNARVRQIDLMTGIISRLAGTTAGFSGDGGVATSCQLSGPYGITCDGLGNVYFADAANRRIRVVATPGSVAISGPTSAPTGTTVTYTAHPSIKASSTTGTTYKWLKNGSVVSTGSTTYSNSSPVNGDVYSFVLSVTPVCGTPYDDTSNSITLSVYGIPTPTGTGEVHGEAGDIRIFPNPAHQALSIEGSGLAEGAAAIMVYDQTGRQVLTETTKVKDGRLTGSIGVQALPPAVYLVVISDASGNYSRLKFVKN
jgi:hypothetical protein